ncbi:MAG: transglycosylase SLT domain-containing protein [Desulfovibrio sp.]|uniref:transglycosylase SLT domain-containing protein n=1 Tax=Desulfovibrio sp. TaxID=885 RepID=UPI0039E6C766
MKRHKTILIIASCLGSALLLLGLLAGFVPQKEGHELRRRVSPVVVSLRPEDMPTPIVSWSNGSRQWSLRRAASPVVAVAGAALPGGVEDELFSQLPDASAQLASVLALDGVSMPFLLTMQPPQYGDALDSKGQPLRWLAAETLLEGYSPFIPRSGSKGNAGPMERDGALSGDSYLSYGSLPARAARYQQLVENFARRYNLSTELVYAIIHSESSFSTTLVSHKSAMGLMQILPDTASGEVHKYLYGHTGDVSFEELRVPEINIRYGTTYLHILLTRYFAGVYDPLAREYCAVAAYNMGPNRFLRLFGKTNEEAVDVINGMTADQLYEDLTNRLPVAETRAYVAKVARMKGHYAALQ